MISGVYPVSVARPVSVLATTSLPLTLELRPEDWIELAIASNTFMCSMLTLRIAVRADRNLPSGNTLLRFWRWK
jgi:hypothetical protein